LVISTTFKYPVQVIAKLTINIDATGIDVAVLDDAETTVQVDAILGKLQISSQSH